MSLDILLVEDGDYKSERVCEFIYQQKGDFKITVCKSYSTALKNIVSSRFDLAFIDMSLPTFDKVSGDSSGDFRVYGGMDLARQIKRRKVQLPFLYLTQYSSFTDEKRSLSIEEVDRKSRDEYGNLYLGYIYYEHAGYKWKDQLLEVMSRYE